MIAVFFFDRKRNFIRREGKSTKEDKASRMIAVFTVDISCVNIYFRLLEADRELINLELLD